MKSKYLLCVLALGLLAGCVRLPAGIAPSNTPLEGRTYEILGDVVGTDTGFWLLGFIPISGVNELPVAMEDAKSDKKADALIDVMVEYKRNFWIIGTSEQTRVTAKAIRFTSGAKVAGDSNSAWPKSASTAPSSKTPASTGMEASQNQIVPLH